MITTILGPIKGRVIQSGFHETAGIKIWHPAACLVNHDLLGKIFLKLAKFSSFVAASIPHSFLNSTGKPFNRWRIQLHAGMSEIYINTPVKHFRRKNARN